MFKNLFRKKTSPFLKDIKEASAWAVENLTASGYEADFSLDSIAELDRFIEEEKEGILQQEDRGIIFFALGAYLGETLLSLYEGEWVSDEEAPEALVRLAVQLSETMTFYPIQACMKRYKKGESASLYSQLIALFQRGAELQGQITGQDAADDVE